jgi:prophage tail gpP-like protein
MTFTLHVERADGSTETLRVVQPDTLGDGDAPSLSTLFIRRQLRRAPDRTDDAEAVVFRDAWTELEATIDPATAKFTIEDSGTPIFGGRLRDSEINGAVVSLLLDTAKRDTLQGTVSAANVSYASQPDVDILQSILDRTPTVSVGTTDSQQSLAFSEASAKPGASITRLAEATGAELRYQPDFTLDYLDRVGSDRTTTLSPSNGTVISDPRVRRDDREPATHVVVVGDGVREEAVISSYDSSEDRRIEAVIRDDSISTSSAAQARADTEADRLESEPRLQKIELAVPPTVDAQVGDTFPVDLPEDGVDRDLRVVRADRRIDQAGDRTVLTLATRPE